MMPTNNFRADRNQPFEVAGPSNSITFIQLTGDDAMRRRTILKGAITAVAGLAMTTGMAVAQKPSDTNAVEAASKAFYEALNTGVEPMLKVYAKTNYVVFVGPGMKAAAVGWDDVKKAIEGSWVTVPKRSVTIMGSRIQVRGALAWETGNELGAIYAKDGTERKIDVIVTNIYEKIDGQWLMVSHHAQPKPQ